MVARVWRIGTLVIRCTRFHAVTTAAAAAAMSARSAATPVCTSRRTVMAVIVVVMMMLDVMEVLWSVGSGGRIGAAALKVVVLGIGVAIASVLVVDVVAVQVPIVVARPAGAHQSARRDVLGDAQHVGASGLGSFAVGSGPTATAGTDTALIVSRGATGRLLLLLGSSAAATAAAASRSATATTATASGS